MHDVVGCTWKEAPTARAADEPFTPPCSCPIPGSECEHGSRVRHVGDGALDECAGPDAAWVAELPAAVPTVLVPAREASKEEQPSGARRLAVLAAEYGWDVRVTYAEAIPVPTKRQPEPDVIRTVAVRMERLSIQGHRSERLVGLWRNGRYDFGGSEWVRVGYRELVRRVT
jgi:hypothetical protein